MTIPQNMQYMTAADLVDNEKYNTLHNNGNVAYIDGDVYYSNTFTDIVVIETEFGSLYVPEDMPIEVFDREA